MIQFGGRGSKKVYAQIYNRVNDLYGEIELCKSLGVPYKEKQKELEKLLKLLDGGKNGKEAQSKSNNKTKSKKWTN